MKTKFTALWLDALKATGKDYAVGDAECKGLTIRVSAKGVKTFALPYHSPVRKKTVMLKLGRYPTLSLKGARLAVGDARKAIDEGRDPVPFFVGGSDAAPVTEKLLTTYGALVAIYDTEVLVNQRTRRDRRRLLERMGERYGWTDRVANEITPIEAAAALKHMVTAHGPVAALAAKSILRTMFKWARQPEHGYVLNNPFGDLGAPAKKNKPRDRKLSIDELVRVWTALDNTADYGIVPHYAIALRLIFLTAARPGMVTGMERGELLNLNAAQPKVRKVDLDDVASIDTRNFEIVGPAWSLAAARMKKDRPYTCPLSPLAIALIKSSMATGKHVIAAPGRKRIGVSKLSDVTRKIYKALDIARFTPHDLRRTAASMLGMFGWDDAKIALLLAHEAQTVTGKVYNHATVMNLKRAMVLLLEKIITDHVAPATAPNVVTLRAA